MKGAVCAAGGVLFLAGLLAGVSGCSASKAALHAFRSTEHFVSLEADPRVLYEPGAEAFAHRVAELLPEAVGRVEKAQYGPFVDAVAVHVCTPKESFSDMTGRTVRVIVEVKGLFLSPLLLDEPEEIGASLTHELSHLHLRQRLGSSGFAKLPFWFTGGLATFVSGGGGAQGVGFAEAAEAMAAGKHCVPNEKGGILFRKTPSHWGLPPHLFYRQRMMFVSCLHGTDEGGFRVFLLSLEDGNDFRASLREAFGGEIPETWEEFRKEVLLQNIKAAGGQG